VTSIYGTALTVEYKTQACQQSFPLSGDYYHLHAIVGYTILIENNKNVGFKMIEIQRNI
jgi:hypothetical protein